MIPQVLNIIYCIMYHIMKYIGKCIITIHSLNHQLVSIQNMKVFFAGLVFFLIQATVIKSFVLAPNNVIQNIKNDIAYAAPTLKISSLSLAAPADSDFEKAIPVKDQNFPSKVDENVYNVDVKDACEIWQVSVSPEDRLDRPANTPFLDSKSKDHFVEDIRFVVSRDGGMGIELLELAGGRDDDFGLTIVSGVSGNAEKVSNHNFKLLLF